MRPDQREFIRRIDPQLLQRIESCDADDQCHREKEEQEEEYVKGFKQDLAVVPPAGALSWDELLQAEQLTSIATEIAKLWFGLEAIFAGIRNSDVSMPEKTRRLRAAVSDFSKRIGEVKGVKGLSAQGLRLETAALLDEFDGAADAAAAANDLPGLKRALGALLTGLGKAARGEKSRPADPIMAYRDMLERKPVGTKERKAVEEAAKAYENDPAGAYWAALLRGGAAGGCC